MEKQPSSGRDEPAGDGWRYSGRWFTSAEMDTIRRITDDPWNTTRADIARAVCEALNWRKLDGELKVVSCHVALKRMEAHGLIWLPLPTREFVPSREPAHTAAGDPQPLVSGTRADLQALRLVPVSAPSESALWHELMARYHYLGRTRMAGAQCRYLAYDGDRVLAALGFGAAAWRLAARDRFIGWTDAQREAHLHLVVQNRRFLVLPWVKLKGLGSSLLAMAARRLPRDWEAQAHYRPVLLETFVEHPRFSGTSYAAANWIRVGSTQGRGRNDRAGRGGKPVKTIWLYPLQPDFRSVLSSGRLAATTPSTYQRRGGAR